MASIVGVLLLRMRKDMYIYSESNVVCTMPKGEFEYICLNESYGGDLACIIKEICVARRKDMATIIWNDKPYWKCLM